MKAKMKNLFGIMLSIVLILGMMPQMGVRVYADTLSTPTVYSDEIVQASVLQEGDILYDNNIDACEGYTFILAAGGWTDSVNAMNLLISGRGSSSANSENVCFIHSDDYFNGDKECYTFPILQIREYNNCPVINIEGDVAYPYYDGYLGECWKVDSVDTYTKTVTLSGYLEQQNDVRISSEVPYVTFNGSLECVYAEKKANTCIKVDSQSTIWKENRWYVVTEDVIIPKRIIVKENANLILADGVTLTAKNGISLKNGSLNIYAQKEGSGVLIAIGSHGSAGIGGFNEIGNKNYSMLRVYGGHITATALEGCAAGIGGGYGNNAGSVTIYRGKIIATGGSESSAGIGGGGSKETGGKGGKVRIYGGEVLTTGKGGGKGIGAGTGDSDNNTLILGTGVALYGSDLAMPEGSGDTDKIETTVNENVATRYTYMKAVGTQPEPAHKHKWNYTLSGATITALCSGAGDCEYKTDGIRLELKAPTSLTYDGETKNAIITGYPTVEITELAIEPTTITYYNTTEAGSTTPEGEAIDGEPKAVGNYVAQMTWGGKTASVPFSINRNTISKTVTFKVVNGFWNEGEGDAATADRIVTLTGYEGDILKLTANQIPAVGSKPKDNTYKEGSWDVTPSTDTAITDATTYTYTFVAIPTYEVTYKVVGGTWSDDSTEDKKETVESGSNPASVPNGMKAASGYTGGAWDTDPTDATITEATTFTYTFTNIPTYEVTYKVVGGTWSDDSTEDKKETVESGSNPASVPNGMIAASGYTGGAWDIDPAEATITEATTFTYTFTEKQDATVTNAPTAKSLTENGSAQKLVNAGTASGGTMQYALGKNKTTAPTSGWSKNIPTGTDAGTYYVWYKVVADNTHIDVKPKCVVAKINEKQKTTGGTITTTGIYCASNYPSIQAGINIQKSNEADTVEYRWVGCNTNDPKKWFEVSPWTKNNNWMDWTPEKSGDYVFVCYARVVGNEKNSLIEYSFGTEYHKHIKGVCQMPYNGEGGGYLIGVESYHNPNNSYQYEILILDCNLYVQNKDPWVYSTGKCGSSNNSFWTVWQPQYGYYWTLFRVYDADGNLIDEACYGFANVF